MCYKFNFELKPKIDGTRLSTRIQRELLLQFESVRGHSQRRNVRGEVDHEVKERLQRVMCSPVFFTRVYARDLFQLMRWKEQMMERAMRGAHLVAASLMGQDVMNFFTACNILGKTSVGGDNPTWLQLELETVLRSSTHRLHLTNLRLALSILLDARNSTAVAQALDFLARMAHSAVWTNMSLTDSVIEFCLRGVAFLAVQNYAEVEEFFIRAELDAAELGAAIEPGAEVELDAKATEAIVAVWRMWSVSTAKLSDTQKESVRHMALSRFMEIIPGWLTFKQRVSCTSILEAFPEERYIFEQLGYLGDIPTETGGSMCDKEALEAATGRRIQEAKARLATGYDVDVGPPVEQDESQVMSYTATVGLDKFVSGRHIINQHGILVPDES